MSIEQRDEIGVAVQSWLRAFERNSVVLGSNPTKANFL